MSGKAAGVNEFAGTERQVSPVFVAEEIPIDQQLIVLHPESRIRALPVSRSSEAFGADLSITSRLKSR